MGKDDLSRARAVKLAALRESFQAGASHRDALSGLLVEHKGHVNYPPASPWRFSLPLDKSYDDDGLPTWTQEAAFFAFTPALEQTCKSRVLGIGGNDELLSALDDSRVAWREFARYAADGVSHLMPGWPADEPIPSGVKVKTGDASDWIMSLVRWANERPGDDFRLVQRVEWRKGMARGSLITLMKIPDESSLLAFSRIDDLWAKSVEFCDWLAHAPMERNGESKPPGKRGRPTTIERDLLILADCEAGYSAADLAKKHGLESGSVRRAVIRAKQHKASGKKA